MPASAVGEEKLMDVVLEAGADDLQRVDDDFEVTCTPSAFGAVQDALEKAGITASASKLAMLPTNTIELDGKKAGQCLKLLDALEDHEDVQNVFANLTFDEASVAEEA